MIKASRKLMAQVLRASEEGQKVRFMNFWLIENVDQFAGMTTVEKQEFMFLVFGSRSYLTELNYAKNFRDHVQLRPDWRQKALGWHDWSKTDEG